MKHLSAVLILLTVWSAVPAELQAQSAYIPLNKDVYHLVERYEIRAGAFNPRLHTHLKPYQRRAVAYLADSVWLGLEALSPQDKFNLDYLRNDSWEWSNTTEADSRKPILKGLYQKKSDFYHVQTPKFDLHLNLVLYGFVGRDSEASQTPYLNTRGIELRGMIARKLGFYTFLTDNQAVMPTYVTEFINQNRAVPGEGYYKRTIGGNNLDFISARGYITFEAIKDIINIQFGYDKNQIGNGYRSLVLSDFASNYLFLKVNTQVWRINYQNLFAQLNAETFNGDGFFPQKYMALHHLSMNITKNFNLGLFESIIFNRSDSLSGSRAFDFRYLNPIIFYRSMEQQAGSPDNANVGIDFKWHLWKRLALYGQLMIDELQVREAFNGKGWRGNKQAIQLGAKYIDAFGVSNLDLQGEINLARPYTYSHNLRYGEYSHYNQALAHPRGANFDELIGIVRYQPIPRLNVVAKGFFARSGTDTPNRNYGSNIFLNNTVNVDDYDNRTGQGVKNQWLLADLTLSWQLRHNVFVDLRHIYRRVQSDDATLNRQSNFSSIAFRWNIAPRSWDF